MCSEHWGARLFPSYDRLMVGDCTARDELIVAALPFVEMLVKKFVKRRPGAAYQVDDLQGEAMLLLVKTVDELASRDRVDNPASFIYNAVRRRLSDLAVTPGHIKKSARQAFRDIAANKENAVPVRVEMPEDIVKETRRPADDVKESILFVCQDERDREIVALREDGFCDEEIGKKVNLSTSAVLRRRRRIERQYCEPHHALGV